MNPFQPLLDRQRNRALAFKMEGAKGRIERLRRLQAAVEDRKASLYEALRADFRKPDTETDLTEIYPFMSELEVAVKTWQVG